MIKSWVLLLAAGVLLVLAFIVATMSSNLKKAFTLVEPTVEGLEVGGSASFQAGAPFSPLPTAAVKNGVPAGSSVSSGTGVQSSTVTASPAKRAQTSSATSTTPGFTPTVPPQTVNPGALLVPPGGNPRLDVQHLISQGVTALQFSGVVDGRAVNVSIGINDSQTIASYLAHGWVYTGHG